MDRIIVAATTKPELTEEKEILELFLDGFSLNYILVRYRISEPLLRSIPYWNWLDVCITQTLSEQFILDFEEHLDIATVSIHQNLSTEFLYQNAVRMRMDFTVLGQFQRLSEEFIRDFKEEFDWRKLSLCQDLSDQFIIEMSEYVDFDTLFILKGATYPIILKFLSKSTVRDLESLKLNRLSEEEIEDLERIFKFTSLFKK